MSAVEVCAHPLAGQLQPIFSELYSGKAAALSSAISKLECILKDQCDGLLQGSSVCQSRESSMRLSRWIGSQIMLLFGRPETQLAGILCVETLLEVEYEDTNNLVQSLLNPLENCVTSADMGVSKRAAQVWGMWLTSSGKPTKGIAQSRLDICVRDLQQSDSAVNKVAACLFLQELLKRAPTSVVPSLDFVAKGLLSALRGPSPLVQECAAATLHYVLLLMYTSMDTSAVNTWQDKFLAISLDELATRDSKRHIGALQCFNALISSATNSNTSYDPAVAFSPSSVGRVHEIWDYVNEKVIKRDNDPELQKELLNSLTTLALYDTETFRCKSFEKVLKASSDIFLSSSNQGLQLLAFQTVGKLAGIVPDQIGRFLACTMLHIEEALTQKTDSARCLEAVSCFASFAEVNPRAVRPRLRRILAPLLSVALSVDFAKNIARVCSAFPELRSTCLCKVLEVAKQQLSVNCKHVSKGCMYNVEIGPTLQILSALGSLEFSGYPTLPFLCETAIAYVSVPNEDVRRAAIGLCFKLIFSGCTGSQSPCKHTSDGVVVHSGREHIRLFNQVVEKLVNAAVADPESDIRLATLKSFTEEFDLTLALRDVVRSLFPALHDKHQNRLAVVQLLGRVSRRNPVHVYPMLRKIMVQCVTEMQYFEHAKKQEQALSILGAIVESAPGLGKPYVSSLLNICVARLSNETQDAAVCAALLSCVGKLVRYAEGDDVHVCARIRPVVVQHILDSSHLPKKKEALRALGDIVRTTKDVNVYENHPELLPVLLQALHGGFKELWPVREDVLQLMGIIGAVDPVRVKEILRGSRVKNSSTEVIPHLVFEGEVSIAQTVVRSVLHILSLPSLTEDQSAAAVRVIVDILSMEKLSSGSLVQYYGEIISSIQKQARTQVRKREEIITHFISLVHILKGHLRPHLREITSTVSSFILASELSVLKQVLALLKQLCRSLREEFRPYMSSLLGPIIRLVEENVDETSEIVLDFFSAMGPLLEGHLHTVLPVVCNVIVNSSVLCRYRIAAVNTLICFARELPDLCFHASRCVHCLCRVLGESDGVGLTLDAQLVKTVLDAFCTIAVSLGRRFDNFSPVVFPVVADFYGRTSKEYSDFCHAVCVAARSGEKFTMVRSGDEYSSGACADAPSSASRGELAPGLKSQSNAYASLRFHLRKRVQMCDEDWNHWLPQLAVNLLRSSPSPSHACALRLAELHGPFARQMLYSAFAACYADMDEHTQREVIDLLTEVLRGPRAPGEVMQELLNLAEHMERQGIRLSVGRKESIQYSSKFCPFDRKVLMESSARCNLYSKALHYVEIEFFETIREYERSVLRGCPKPLPVEAWQNLLQLCEKGIYFCNLLGQRESANGMLKFIQQNFSLLTGKKVTELSQMMDAHLFDKLQWWSQSLHAYGQRLQQEPNKVSNMIGVLKALDALGEYPRELDMWRQFSKRVSKKEVANLATMGARAAWLLRRWEDMEHITSLMSDDDYVGITAMFYKCTLLARKKQFCEAKRLISLCRRRVDSKLSALVAESYDRAYDLFVGIQQLSELEELTMAAQNLRRAGHWQQLWERRLSVMAYEGWSGSLTNHTLLIPPSSEIDMWLRFVSLSRAHGQESVSNEVLYELLGNQSIERAIDTGIPPPAIAMGAFQHLYETNNKDAAIATLHLYVNKVENSGIRYANREREDMAVCHAKLAEWLAEQKKTHRTAEEVQLIFSHLLRATDLDKKNGAIWRMLARAHRETATKASVAGDSASASIQIVKALDAYLRSVSLSEELEDALGFLSLWFMCGSLPSVQANSTLKAEIEEVNPTVWLKVIPQIIARISSPDAVVADSVYNILVLIAKRHPQAILYSLNVAHTSCHGKSRKEGVEPLKGSQRVLSRIAELHQNGKSMVAHAALACRELVRCAVLWPELWIDELGRALCQWERHRSVHGLMQVMEPLLNQLKKPETMAETQFAAEFGKSLEDARSFVQRSAALDCESLMEDARRHLVSVERRLREQVSGMSSLALQLVSPELQQNGRNLSLVVPGQYKENGNYPQIASFQNVLKVLNSKQRPRRIYINGSNGEVYKFLLKGHEDLRLDERVMQLLGFVNTILEKHSVAKRHDCLIQTYSVTPLSDNAGLVGWVDHCDTLNQIIEEYRVDPKCIRMELDLMRSMCDNLYYLSAIQRVEPFEFALGQTEGVDLVRSFWVKAPSAETWLERRTTYVCSLATMSMVGHILGLGDRHPSNLMIHAFSGRVVHIDFGDCFEVAQNRSIHPEKVPFRLTRMLVKAMEMGGIEGLFRHGCITVMNALREEGSSLLALLEAFVHDPLVSWWRDDVGDFTLSGQGLASIQTTSMIESLRFVPDECDVGSAQASPRSMQRRVGLQRGDGDADTDFWQTRKARSVVRRIKRKLRGLEYPQSQKARGSDGFTVEEQVARLIEEATLNENLCVHFLGWCPFW